MRDNVRSFLELDRRAFADHNVNQLFLAPGPYIGRVIDLSENDPFISRLRSPPEIWLRARNRLPGRASYASSYGRFTDLHRRLRQAVTDDQHESFWLLVGIRSDVHIPDGPGFSAPLDSIRIYAGEDSLQVARVVTESRRRPHLRAHPLPSAMAGAAADTFRVADALAQSGLL